MLVNNTKVLTTLFIVLLISFSLPTIVEGFLEVEVSVENTIDFPRGYYYLLGFTGYLVYDYDNDHVKEMIVALVNPNLYLVPSIIYIFTPSTVEKEIQLRHFIPFHISIVNNQLVIYGYFVNESTYGVEVYSLPSFKLVNQALLQDKYILQNPPWISHVSNNTIIYYTFTLSNGSQLIMYDMSYDIVSVAWNSEVLILSKPVIFGNKYILWGSYIFRLNSSRQLELQHILLENVLAVYSTIFDNRIYLIAYNENNTYMYVYSLCNYELISKYKLSYVKNPLYGHQYGDHIVFFAVNTSDSYSSLAFYILNKTSTLTPLLNVKGVYLGMGLTPHYIYLYYDGVFSVVDPILNDRGFTRLENIGFNNRFLPIVTYDTNTVIILDNDKAIIIKISISEVGVTNPIPENPYVAIILFSSLIATLLVKLRKRT